MTDKDTSTRRDRDSAGRRANPPWALVAVGALIMAALSFGFALRSVLPGNSGTIQPIVVDSNGIPLVPGSGADAGTGGTAAGTATGEAQTCKRPDERSGTGELYHGTDPDRELLAYSPFRVIRFPCPNFEDDLRVVLLYRDAIVLVQGGAVQRSIPFDASDEVAFEDIVSTINQSDWMAETEDGTFLMDTAFVQLPGTRVVVAGPDVSELRMTTRPHVFFGGRGAEVLFQDTKVTSWDASRGGPDLLPDDGRAFVLYERGSRLDIVDSEMAYLGSDRSKAYGVSWHNGGTTGTAIRSVFDHNWFGVYTAEAKDILFQGNTFSNSALYGLDPHDYSSGLIVENNIAFGNGKHGLIFSRGVVDGVLRNNHVYANGGNGIVLDLESHRNVIENNLVEANGGDGIVLIGSGESQIVGNTVRGNRTGIRVHRFGTSDVEITGNLLDSNRSGIHAYEGAADIRIENNVIRNSGRTAIDIEAGATEIRDVEITGASIGIQASTAVDITNATISDVERGVVGRAGSIIQLQDSRIQAVDSGVRLYNDSTTLIGDRVDVAAAQPVLEPVPALSMKTLLPIFGIIVIALGISLEALRFARIGRQRAANAPQTVTNIS